MPTLSYLLSFFLPVLSTDRNVEICAFIQKRLIAACAVATQHSDGDHRDLQTLLQAGSWRRSMMETLMPRQSSANVCNRVCNGACV